ncbi:hypothetical protein L1049_006573 [Liquidambar formosana]|uniref:Pre-mRNA polyadenylation factor Fip1 domain-containing protein n=1 Tax=Liquidambar formosana TaxID=63359 RepID=A0AAP0RG37_LIQFO
MFSIIIDLTHIFLYILVFKCHLHKNISQLGKFMMGLFNSLYILLICRHIFRTVDDINIDSFEDKPSRHPGVLESEFFNFGLNKEKWKDYCKQLASVHLPLYFTRFFNKRQ